jgi:hypothetical protein
MCLACHHNAIVVFDQTYPDLDMGVFKTVDWKPMYGDAKKALPHNSPGPHGKEVDLWLYVDSDHVGEESTR